MRRTPTLILAALVILAACTLGRELTGGQNTQPPQPTPVPASAGPSRDLVIGVRYELPSLHDQLMVHAPAATTLRMFNATLALVDHQGKALPYLAESLPQLNTDSWKLLQDGQMETTYRLREGLTWHDGRPLTAQDFAFALLVYATPPLTMFDPTPVDRIVGIGSPDPRTVVIRWAAPYPDAGTLRARQFSPLPRHLLESAWQAQFAALAPNPDGAENFMSLPYWTREFVGAGPYRLERWEPGSHIEAVAFEGHALGKPKIERVTLRFISDENALLTGLRSEAVHLAADNALGFEQAQALQREWASSRRGVVLLDPVQPYITSIQLRPEYVNPRGLLDVRVRRALAHALDRQALVDRLFVGTVPVSDQLMPRSVPYFAELDRAVRKYPYDLRQAEQLLGEAGYRKGADGIYGSADGERLIVEHRVLAGGQNEAQGALMGASFRQAGFEVREHVVPTPQALDGQVRATFPSLASGATRYGEAALAALTSDQIPSPLNRWRGANHGGWSNPSYDRLWVQLTTTLERATRNRQITALMQLATEEVPVLFLFHNPAVTAHLAGLRGPVLGPPDHVQHWNLHEWEFQ